MRGRVALVVAVGLVVLTGCLSPLPDDDAVDHSDRWNTTDDVTYFLEDDTFTAVVRVDNLNGTELEIWQRDPFGGDNPVQVAGVEFREDDGDVIQLGEDEVDTSGDRTVVTLPAEEGRLAYVAEKRGGEFSHPSPVTGTVRVHVPEGRDARDFFLGRISPGEYQAAGENPLVLRWDELERGTYVTVEYYREGYPYVLIGALVLLVIAAAAVVYYYRRLLEEQKRKKLGP